MAKKTEQTEVVETPEQQGILGELKRELDEKRKNAVKKYVTTQLREISNQQKEIAEAEAEYKERLEEAREAIAEAEKAIKAVEDGDFSNALAESERLAELPQAQNWISWASASTTWTTTA